MKIFKVEANAIELGVNPDIYEPTHLLRAMKESFLHKFKDSLDKDELLMNEIRYCEMVFDNNLLPISFSNLNDRFPLDEYCHIIMNTKQIYLIRKAYDFFILLGKPISEAKGWLSRHNRVLPLTEAELLIYLNFAQTIREYNKWLKNALNENEYIIEAEYIGLLYNKFSNYFDKESKEIWKSRFHYPSLMPITPISVSREAREGTSALILIAILASIQQLTENKFDFEQFVLERFGIKSFEKKKSDHSYKKTYKETFEKSNYILKK
jgi:hypothetical protein